MKYLFFAVAILYYNPAFAQKQDYVWLLGYAGGNQSTLNDSFGISILRFDSLNQLSIVNNQSCDLNLSGTNSTVSDSTGNLLFFTNGEKVYNSNYTLMSNGNNLNVSNSYGTTQPQGALSLPIPDQKDKYLMLISEVKYISTEVLYAGYKVYKNIIDLTDITGLGKVVEKKLRLLKTL